MKQYSMKRSTSKLEAYENAKFVYAAAREQLPVLQNLLTKNSLFLQWLNEKPTLTEEEQARVEELAGEVKDLGAEILACQKKIDNSRRIVSDFTAHSFHQAG